VNDIEIEIRAQYAKLIEAALIIILNQVTICQYFI
jgi:hypothetical protein